MNERERLERLVHRLARGEDVSLGEVGAVDLIELDATLADLAARGELDEAPGVVAARVHRHTNDGK